MGLTGNCFLGQTVFLPLKTQWVMHLWRYLPQLAQCVHLGLPRTHAYLHCSQAAGSVRGSLTFCGPQGPHLGTQHGHPWETHGVGLGRRLPQGPFFWDPCSDSQVWAKGGGKGTGAHVVTLPSLACVSNTLTRWEVWILTAAPLQRYHKVTAQYHAISL